MKRFKKKYRAVIFIASLSLLPLGFASAFLINVSGKTLNIPDGEFSLPDISFYSYDHPVNSGDTFSGNSSQTIPSSSPLCDGCFLNFSFDFNNYVLSPDSNINDDFFSGGTFNIYISIDGDPEQLFLSGEGHVDDDNYTLEVENIAAQGPSSGVGYLDITGGIAENYFDTNHFLDGSDIKFDLNNVESGTNILTGDVTFTAFAANSSPSIPEPNSLSLMGLSLFIIGFISFRTSLLTN
ncbi:hypothetical protein [Candidatus Nitrosacidococcus sp. I8]|uniref:hypothetical protein n=1 Tax=Candidatus Nitrosacidococcus sp. I8 TaxID=2942908 RepID=UPI002227C3A4|nr:hypothetical protein [Candidatus Nitrosacidococcus sp. I8]CAH9019565.1 hypothetical protein NURINAE_01624 [Candidatus Nitrosacidococcus sp. I8]